MKRMRAIQADLAALWLLADAFLLWQATLPPVAPSLGPDGLPTPAPQTAIAVHAGGRLTLPKSVQARFGPTKQNALSLQDLTQSSENDGLHISVVHYLDL